MLSVNTPSPVPKRASSGASAVACWRRSAPQVSTGGAPCLLSRVEKDDTKKEAAGGRVTIIDVARHAGVSFKTVSRVLNQEPNVRQSKREAVLASVRALGYRQNMMARHLRKREPRYVALLFHNPSPGYVNAIQLGAIERCRYDGYHLVVEDCIDHEHSMKTLVNEPSLAGALVTPPLSDDRGILDFLDAQGIRYVRLAPTIELERAPAVSIDDEKAAFEMTAHLLSLGHRRIGFIKGPATFGVSQLRLDGYLRALRSSGIEPEPSLTVTGKFSYESGLECGEQLLGLPRRPTAIFASNDDMAAAVLAVAYKRDIKVPTQLSVAGFDDTPVAHAMCPQLTTIRQPLATMAKHSVDLLLDAASATESNGQVLLPHPLIVRRSTAAPDQINTSTAQSAAR